MNSRVDIGVSLMVLLAVGACGEGNGGGLPFQTVGRQPDIAPVMLNNELPFRYPPALYAQRVQGNVTLRIYIDKNGEIVADSTRVAETSGFSALDSAAMKGSRDLRFEPAKTQGQAVPVSILLPVYFRHPDAAPLAGDSIIGRDSVTISRADSARRADSVRKADSLQAAADRNAAKTPIKRPVPRARRGSSR
ncbi:MAG: energy transducer TonB [Gemmatimonadaceae bacterium]